MAPKVAIVTGGVSGMGLSVVEALVESKQWHVTILDINASLGQKVVARLGGGGGQNVGFVQLDATVYEEQARAFEGVWRRWGRVDFVFANAGHGDVQEFYTPVETTGDSAPPKPNMQVVDVCLDAVIYSYYLGMHYLRKTAKSASKDWRGKLVATSSMCGLYPNVGLPLYTAAKHGVVGLTRNMAYQLAQRNEPITVNCICPGLVDTGLTHHAMPFVPDTKHITPHSTIVRAVQQFLDDDSLNGQVAECSAGNVHHRQQLEFADEEAEWLMSGQWHKEVPALTDGTVAEAKVTKESKL